MRLVESLASSLDQRGEEPNKAIARSILQNDHQDWKEELYSVIQKPPSHALLADALKVAEYICFEKSEIMLPLTDQILQLIDHSKNHIVWRSMAVLSKLSKVNQVKFYAHLSSILRAMDQGTVITKDHGFKILIDLYAVPEYTEDLFYLMNEQILKAPDNQLGQYAEKWMLVIQKPHIKTLTNSLIERLPNLEKPAHQKRVGNILKKLQKIR